MTERQYIIVTNLAKARAAKALLADCLCELGDQSGKRYGIPANDFASAHAHLNRVIEVLEKAVPPLRE